ncbi:MAG: PorT family protein [Mediterranea sp.]|jgi:hypothetical protein|nr:PorT family protein [Mediterranea sp.]
MHLKQRISAGAFLILLSLPAAAQVGELRNNLAVGLNGGININSVTFSPIIKQGNLMGLTGGLTARYISEKYFAMICGVQLEVNYSQHGWKEKYENLSDSYSRTMGYVEIPLLAHLAFGKDNGVQFFLNLGPQIGFLLTESEKYGHTDGEWTSGSNIREQYGKWADNKFDYGITGGAGFELRTKAGHYLIEGRYYFALSDFYGNTKKDFFSRSAHSVLQAKVTCLFDLSR